MAKRGADEFPPGVESLPKKLQPDFDYHAVDEPDYDDASTPAHTPDSFNDPSSPATTTVTTPRTRFPSDLKTLPCTWPGCPKTFNRPARLRDHLNSHTNSRPFQCPYEDCDKDYTVDKHLKQHIKAVHTHERKHVCQREGCGKSFVTGTRLKRHQAVHEGAERFRCDKCGQSFRKRDTLNKHVRKDHEGRKAFSCSEPGCHVEFDTKASLNRHREREHGEAKYWCDECGCKPLPDGTVQRVGFTTELLLQAHVKQEHQNCIFCDFKSSRHCNLEQHIEIYHSGKTVQERKIWECTQDGCSKRFTSRSNRTNHIRIAHEGLRFVCGDFDLSASGLEGWSNDQGCGDKFSAKARLEDHVRYLHLGQERPKLSAPVYTQPEDFLNELSGVTLMERANVHCTHCTDVFTRYADLDTHIERVHKLSPEIDLSTFEPHQAPLSSMFEDEFTSTWAERMPEEEIFAAEMDCGTPDDEWPEDEANILLLARDLPELESYIDPNLG